MPEFLNGRVALVGPVGGGGVSTVTLSIASRMALDGARVLMIDLDPALGLSRLTGVFSSAGRDAASSDGESGETDRSTAVRATAYQRLSVLSWGSRAPWAREGGTSLADVLNGVSGDYDTVMLDTSRRRSDELKELLGGMDHVLVVQPVEPLAIRQLEGTLGWLSSVQSLEGRAVFLGVVMNRVQTDAPMFELMFRELQRVYGSLVCKTVIPYDPWFVESALRAMPLPELLPEARGALAVSKLLEELKARA